MKAISLFATFSYFCGLVSHFYRTDFFFKHVKVFSKVKRSFQCWKFRNENKIFWSSLPDRFGVDAESYEVAQFSCRWWHHELEPLMGHRTWWLLETLRIHHKCVLWSKESHRKQDLMWWICHKRFLSMYLQHVCFSMTCMTYVDLETNDLTLLCLQSSFS